MSEPDYTRDGWWNDLPAVDDWEPAFTRDPDLEPDETGRAHLAELAARLDVRADMPDVQAFIRGERP